MGHGTQEKEVVGVEMREYFFETEQLAVGYGGIPFINQIEIKLRQGEILTLIGPNGSGKSTILKSIAKQLELIDGTIYIGDNSIYQWKEREFAKTVSVVFTERIRTEMMTCEDVVAAGRYPYTGRLGILSEADKEKVLEAMEQVHIQEWKDWDFMTLSDGQKQRVLIARALCQEPELLILDEPTSYLDIKHKLEFLSMIQTLTREKKMTVIMAIHELDLAERISNQILCVKNKMVDRYGAPWEIFNDGYIPQLYEIGEGCYQELFGSIELPPAKGEPEIFILAGGGSGVPVYRKLQRLGIPFSVGILGEQDVEYPIAKALAVRVIGEKAYCSITEETREKAREEIDRCETVFCCLQEFGDQNECNQELLLYAKKQGKVLDCLPNG